MKGIQTTSGNATFRVLAAVEAFEPGFRGGGPIKSLARIVDTAPEGIEVFLITRDRDLGSEHPYPGLSGKWISRGRSRVFYLGTKAPRQWLGLIRELRAKPFDLIYLNSLWEPIFTIIPVLFARLRLVKAKNILLAPRGELSPSALTSKDRKKRLFLKAWRPLLNSMDIEWHASTDREAVDICTIFPNAQVQVNDDQASLPGDALPVEDEHEGPVRLAFISRISPNKNLLLALEALQLISAPAEFDIYGPIEDAIYWTRCKSIIESLTGDVRVTYHRELAPGEVRETFSKYDAFVFPTLGENFGHVIAESLSAGCPVICSTETPWTDLLEEGAGMVVRDLSPAGLAVTLQRVASMSSSERVTTKTSAADAYLAWRSRRMDRNILGELRDRLIRS